MSGESGACPAASLYKLLSTCIYLLREYKYDPCLRPCISTPCIGYDPDSHISEGFGLFQTASDKNYVLDYQ